MLAMNWHHVAHIIRDVFPNRDMTVVYGEDEDFIDVLRSNEHSIGAFMLHTNRRRVDLDDTFKGWEAGVNSIFFGPQSIDLFISIGYNPSDLHPHYHKGILAMTLRHSLKPGGKALIVNPGPWADLMSMTAKRDTKTEQELKRYSIFAHEQVAVYEPVDPFTEDL